MDWYRKSQNEESVFNLSDHIFIEDVENMAQRMWNQFDENLRETPEQYKSWSDWLQREDINGLSQSIGSDSVIYELYLKDLPEGIDSYDVITAYKNGQLKHKQYIPQQQEKVDLSDFGSYDPKFPWHFKKKEYSEEELSSIFIVAKMRVSKTNSGQVLDARKKIFLAFNNIKDLPEILGIQKSELNKFIISWSGMPLKAMQTQNSFNSGVGEEHQWSGIQNTSFLNMRSILPEEIDGFVKAIVVPTKEQDSYRSAQGNNLRKEIMNAFMAIDTGLSYSDLTFVIEELDVNVNGRKEYLGIYYPKDTSIHVGVANGRTISHEIGHYLDNKFGREFGETLYGLTDASNSGGAGPERVEWKKRFKNFVKTLTMKGDIGSTYLQRPPETFSRFVAYFVNWTVNGGKYVQDSYKKDKFDDYDCRQFVKLLQEKSYIDKHYPIQG